VASRKKTTGARSRGARPEAGGKQAGKAGAARKAATPAAAPSRFPEVEELVELMNRHELIEVDYQTAPDGTRRIKLARAGSGGYVMSVPAPGPRAGAPAPAPAHAPAAPPAAPAPAAGETLHAFKSPMVGTFYRASSPEAPPFASVGDKLDPHATVCIIEAMKVMNEITPDVSGTVVSIEVENGEAVEFGQTLFLVRPN